MVANALAERWGLSRPKDRFRGRLAEGRARPDGAPPDIGHGVGAPRVAMLWPLTYMNDVGRSVGPARGSYHLPLERVLVVHDEIDLPFGEVRTRLGGGLAGHNGLKSVRNALGGAQFWRVRVGVGRPNSTEPDVVASYVLSRFREPPAEVAELTARAADAAERVVLDERPPTPAG